MLVGSKSQLGAYTIYVLHRHQICTVAGEQLLLQRHPCMASYCLSSCTRKAMVAIPEDARCMNTHAWVHIACLAELQGKLNTKALTLRKHKTWRGAKSTQQGNVTVYSSPHSTESPASLCLTAAQSCLRSALMHLEDKTPAPTIVTVACPISGY